MTQHIEPTIDHRAHFDEMARASGPISRYFLLKRAVKSYVKAHEEYFRACQELSGSENLQPHAFNAAAENMTSGGFVGGYTFNNWPALKVLAALAKRKGISLEDPRFSGSVRPAPGWCRRIASEAAARPSSQPA